jgi:signal transduction histidine kinase
MKVYRQICDKISHIGMDETLSIYKKKRVLIFNRLNAFGLFLALLWFIYTLIAMPHNIQSICLNLLPFIISICSYVLMHIGKHKIAIYANTLLIPLAISIASIHIKEGSILLYLIIYSIFPFFYHTKFSKIILHYLYISLLYTFSIYNIEQHFIITGNNIFSPVLQVAELLFLFAILFSVKVQVMAYEKALKKNKELVKTKNEELTQILILKDQIFTVIAHDIIVPLTSIRNLTKEALVEKYSAEEIREIFPPMADEITKTHDLFKNLLDWSKSQLNGNGKSTYDAFISKIAFKAIEQVHFQAKNKGVRIINEIENDVCANINADNLLVVMRNLLVNAIKFTPENGIVILTTSEKYNHLYIQVRDTGVGMDAEKAKRIFGNEFYSSVGTSAESGSGFGLKICKQLLLQNNGNVYCESTAIGEGSTFVIKVPEAKVKLAVLENAVA